MDYCPKVLILSHNIYEETNNIGKTLISLFHGWPIDKICQVYLRNEEPSYKFCKNYYRITDKEILLSVLKGKTVVGTPLCESAEFNKKTNSSNEQTLYSIGNKRIPIISAFRDLMWSLKTWKNNSFREWLISQKPDIILFVPNDYALIYPIADYISSLLSIPVVPYYMDDPFYFSLFVSPIDYLRRIKIRKKAKKIIDRCKNIITIGPKMSFDYTRYFHKECVELMNSVFPSKYVPENSHPFSSIFKILYVGNLHSNRWKAILKIGKAILKYNLNIKIQVYSGSFISKTIEKKMISVESIELCGKLSPVDVEKTLKKADGLLFVESFDRKSSASTKYSLSTKIPEYLNSFKPILAYGPRNISSIEYLSKNKLAIVCYEEKQLKDALNSIMNKKEYFDFNRISNFIFENHNINKNRQVMKNIIINCFGEIK